MRILAIHHWTCLLILLAPLRLGIPCLSTARSMGSSRSGFWEILQNPFLQKQTWNSFTLDLGGTGSTFLGFFLVRMEQRHQYRGDRWLHVLSLLPLAIPSYPIERSLARFTGVREYFTFGIPTRLVFTAFGDDSLCATRMQCGAATPPLRRKRLR